jgi:hypothetical protein
MTESHLYRVWLGNNNDRRELARFRAHDAEDVLEYLKKHFIKEDVEIEMTDWHEYGIYVIFNVCADCETRLESDDGECPVLECDIQEYIDIEENDDIEPDFKTIFGTTDFYDLTLPKGHEKKEDWCKEAAEVIQVMERIKEMKDKQNKDFLEAHL